MKQIKYAARLAVLAACAWLVAMPNAMAQPPRGGPGGPGFGVGRGGPPGPQFLERLDKNGDGKLTKEEVPDFAWQRLSRLDTNQDGVVSKDELVRAGSDNRPDASGDRRPPRDQSARDRRDTGDQNARSRRPGPAGPRPLASPSAQIAPCVPTRRTGLKNLTRLTRLTSADKADKASNADKGKKGKRGRKDRARRDARTQRAQRGSIAGPASAAQLRQALAHRRSPWAGRGPLQHQTPWGPWAGRGGHRPQFGPAASGHFRGPGQRKDQTVWQRRGIPGPWGPLALGRSSVRARSYAAARLRANAVLRHRRGGDRWPAFSEHRGPRGRRGVAGIWVRVLHGSAFAGQHSPDRVFVFRDRVFPDRVLADRVSADGDRSLTEMRGDEALPGRPLAACMACRDAHRAIGKARRRDARALALANGPMPGVLRQWASGGPEGWVPGNPVLGNAVPGGSAPRVFARKDAGPMEVLHVWAAMIVTISGLAATRGVIASGAAGRQGQALTE